MEHQMQQIQCISHRYCYLFRKRHCLLNVLAALIVLPLVINDGVHAADGWAVEGASGVLRVQGALTESACRLEMGSAMQDITIGETGTGRLSNPGARGTPVAVELKLQDCLPSYTHYRDRRSGILLWSVNQPAVSVSFMAPVDADNPQLVRVQGAEGLALRLTDQNGQDVPLGSRSAPLWLAPGQNILTYNITPERTSAPLVAGPFLAQMNFRLHYD